MTNPLTPLYDAVAWVMEQIHTGLSTFLPPAGGITWVACGGVSGQAQPTGAGVTFISGIGDTSISSNPLNTGVEHPFPSFNETQLTR